MKDIGRVGDCNPISHNILAKKFALCSTLLQKTTIPLFRRKFAPPFAILLGCFDRLNVDGALYEIKGGFVDLVFGALQHDMIFVFRVNT